MHRNNHVLMYVCVSVNFLYVQVNYFIYIYNTGEYNALTTLHDVYINVSHSEIAPIAISYVRVHENYIISY